LIEPALAALASGEVVGLPTDTVYGIGADPFSQQAVERLYRLKGRRPDHPIALLVASIAQASTVVEIPQYALVWVDLHWPGPLTLVGHALVGVPSWLGDSETRSLGVRVPAHDLALELLGAAGPLAVTSANHSGEPESLDHVQAQAVFGPEVAVYLPGICPGGRSSTVIDVTGDRPRVIREGPLVLPTELRAAPDGPQSSPR
jgi:tRNA threonylcarbamoyl adenosine modification protein (Sua5/YciO/YrdC/YwlC family)